MIENIRGDGSDHNLVGVRRKNTAIVDKPKVIFKRVFHKFT